jgi:pimeloyl-ACP methyl ester carboxylesterase
MGSTIGPNFEDVLPTMTTPTLIYVGGDDYRCEAITRAAGLIPNVTFAILPGRDHTPAHQDVDGVVAHAIPFLESVQVGIGQGAPSA